MTWTTKPLPHEKCSCGAEMFVTSASLDGRERERASFREAHALCRSQRPGKPGEWAWIAAGLDPYHAVNLREALKLVPDTGDWHGSLRTACDIALEDHPDAKPNQTAEQMTEGKPHGI